MKNAAAVFTAEELAFIEQHSGVALSNEREYSDDDLLAIHEAITESAPYNDTFESVVDKFFDNFGV